MSFNDYKPAWKAEGLTATERLVLLNLAEHRNGDKDSENFNLCFPGYTTIMKETGLGRGSVSRAIKGLKAKLPLNVAVDPNNRQSNRYYFPWNDGWCSPKEHPVPQGNTVFHRWTITRNLTRNPRRNKTSKTTAALLLCRPLIHRMNRGEGKSTSCLDRRRSLTSL